MGEKVKVPFINVLFKKDSETTLSMCVPPQELAVLTLIARNRSDVTEVGVSDIPWREYDDEEEYERLERVHGADKKRKVTYVERAFGEYHEGRLASTMRRAAAHYAAQIAQDEEEQDAEQEIADAEGDELDQPPAEPEPTPAPKPKPKAKRKTKRAPAGTKKKVTKRAPRKT